MQTQTRTRVSTTATTAIGMALIAASAFAFAAAGVTAVPAPAKLKLQLASIATTQITPGAQNIALFKFTATAQNKDVVVTNFTFNVFGDDDASFTSIQKDVSVANYIQQCSLIGPKGNVLSGPTSINASGTLAFPMRAAVPKGKQTSAEVRCDFVSTPTQSGTSDIFAAAILAKADVQAQEKNGTALPASQIILGTAAGTSLNTDGKVAVSVIGAGTLSAVLDPATPKTGILVSGTTNNPVATYTFTAENEPFVVDTLTLTNLGNDPVADTVTLSYKNQSGATIRTSGFLSNNTVSFRGLSVYVAPGTPSQVNILVDAGTISPQDPNSGDTLTFSLDLDSSFGAAGVNSGQYLYTIGSDILANTFTLRATKPTISLSSGSPSRVPGMGEVMRINVASDSHGDSTLSQIVFNVRTEGMGWNACGSFGNTQKWEFYDVTDPSFKLDDDGDWDFREEDGTTCEPGDALAYAILNLADDQATPAEEILAGSSRTYVLRANTAGASSANGDYIQIGIPNFLPWINSLLWNDGQAAGLIDGTGVSNLPVNGPIISY